MRENEERSGGEKHPERFRMEHRAGFHNGREEREERRGSEPHERPRRPQGPGEKEDERTRTDDSHGAHELAGITRILAIETPPELDRCTRRQPDIPEGCGRRRFPQAA